MNPRVIIAIALSLILAAAVILMVHTSGQKERHEAAGEGPPGTSGGESGKLPDRVMLYYFYGNQSSATGKNIESYTRETVENNFAAELESGKLEGNFINIDRAENEHFIEDFMATYQSVVLVKVRGGFQEEWKKLGRVSELSVDKQEFMAYIKDETESFLAGL
ncbi:MAG: hypothetical protein JXB45_11420 [Candidatus Krumholzibacteriota bacterium]|nr:hypothetical protein [Candidatus Krumholzibacteriota bacterium]